MQFLKIQPKPGLHTDGTAYSAEGTWHDVDKVRFRKGFPEKIGGWVKFITGGILGSCRRLHNWAVNDGKRYLAIGTHLKLYQVATTGGGSTPSTYTDITPIRRLVSISTITTTEDKSVVVIEDENHGALAGDYVTMSGALATGTISAAILNTEHKISALGDLNGSDPLDKYVIQIDGIDVSGVTTDSTTSGTAEYQISIGLDSLEESTTSATGWNVGAWGSGPWGGGATSSADQLRVWSMDNYGDDLVANIRGAGIYYWDESEGGRATLLNEVTRRTVTITGGFSRSAATVTVTDNGHGASVGDQIVVTGGVGVLDTDLNGTYTVADTPTKNTLTYTTSATSGTISNGSATIAYSAGEYSCPTASLACMTSERGRHLIAFGANPIGDSGIDRTMVRWSSSENPAEWLPLSTNSAGFQDLSSGSKIQAVIKTRNEQLIWTDVGIVSMRYTGAPFYFSFSDVGRGMSIISPNAMANADGVVYFMDRGAFYRYSGGVQRLACPVLSTIFEDFNYEEGFKVSCGTNLDYSEIIWFYPSANSAEVDRYVIYNYGEDVWYFGSLARGAWDNALLRNNPQAITINKVSSLGTNPVSVTSGSSTVTITLPSGHGIPDGETVTIILSGLNSLVRRTATLSSAVSRSGTTVTVTDVGHGAIVGDQIVVSSAGDSELNGTYTVESVPTSDSLTYTTTTTGTIASTDATIAYENISDYMLNCQHSATISDGSLTFDIGTLADASGSGGGNEGSLIWENYTFNHESGWNGDGQPIVSYIETGDFDLGDGDRFMSLGRIIPDLEFIDGSGPVTIVMKGRDFPLKTLIGLSESEFYNGSGQSHIRFRARQASMRVESQDGFGWRLGLVRLDARTDGKR